MAEYYLRGSRYYVTYQKNGTRVRHPLKTSEGSPVKEEKVAKYLTNELENHLSRGNSPIPYCDISPMAVFDEYNEYARGFKSEITIRTDKSLIKMFLDTTKPLRLGQITSGLVKSYLDKRISDKEIGHTTANDTIKTLKTFLNFALKRNYVSNNPLNSLSKYRVNIIPPVFLQKKEIIAIIEAAKGEVLYPAIMTAICTGMRLGELRRLQWKDINLDTKKITVMESKSGQFRQIPIHPDLNLNKNDLPFNFVNHLKVFTRIRRKANLRHIGWHSLRHTFASQLIMSAVDLVTVSELLGHADVSTTMIYVHLTKDHLRESINKFKIVTNDVTEIVTRETPDMSVSIGNSRNEDLVYSDDKTINL